jgi:hypothetical protein
MSTTLFNKTLSAFAATLLLACGKPEPPMSGKEALDSLPVSERAALNALLTDAGVSEAALRPVGRFGLDKNPLAIVISKGHITGLRISGTPLASMKAVAGLPELAALWLPDNKLTEIAGLETAAKLTELTLSRNPITTITGLAGVAALESLALDGNALTSVVGFPALAELRTLDLSGNRLTSLAGLAVLPKLWTIRAINNPLTDVEAVRPVRTRGGDIEVPEALMGIALGVNQPRPAGESASAFALKLPKTNGKTEGVHTPELRSTPRVFDHPGRLRKLTGASYVFLVEGDNVTTDPVTIEMSVKRGRVRVYLGDRGGYRYVEATPDTPARLVGTLFAGLNYHMVIEATDGVAEDMHWRVFRK